MSIRVKYLSGTKPEMPNGLEYVMAVMMTNVCMSEITEANFNTFRHRVHMVEHMVEGGGYISTETGARQLTEEELRLFINTHWNVTPLTNAQFKRAVSTAWFNLATEDFLRKSNLKIQSDKTWKVRSRCSTPLKK